MTAAPTTTAVARSARRPVSDRGYEQVLADWLAAVGVARCRRCAALIADTVQDRRVHSRDHEHRDDHVHGV